MRDISFREQCPSELKVFKFRKVDLSTGLFDCVQNEIFENDIVKYNGEYFAVIYQNGSFGLKKDIELPSIDYFLSNILDRSKCKVVGTVYSDLYLLQNQNNKVRCSECEYLTLSDCYGECSKGYIRGIVNASDSCGNGIERTKGAKNE